MYSHVIKDSCLPVDPYAVQKSRRQIVGLMTDIYFTDEFSSVYQHHDQHSEQQHVIGSTIYIKSYHEISCTYYIKMYGM